MTATTTEIAFHRAAPSACPVPSWDENPYRPVTLWEMLQIHARRFVTILDHLNQLQVQIGSGVALDDTGLFKSIAPAVIKDCELMELASAQKQIETIREFLGKNSTASDAVVSHDAVQRMFIELRKRIEEDLEESLFFQIQSDKIRLCFTRKRDKGMTEFVVKSPEEFFGVGVIASFPSTAFEINEASRCLFLDRGTACVFHLMRILELGLRVFADQFGVASDHANWHNIIERIEKAVRNMGNDPTRATDWKDQQEFYSQAATQFMFIKEAWRNYTAHAHGKYTEEEAVSMVINVRAFMQKLATRLHE